VLLERISVERGVFRLLGRRFAGFRELRGGGKGRVVLLGGFGLTDHGNLMGVQVLTGYIECKLISRIRYWYTFNDYNSRSCIESPHSALLSFSFCTNS
jgi:hypothetical protein